MAEVFEKDEFWNEEGGERWVEHIDRVEAIAAGRYSLWLFFSFHQLVAR